MQPSGAIQISNMANNQISNIENENNGSRVYLDSSSSANLNKNGKPMRPKARVVSRDSSLHKIVSPKAHNGNPSPQSAILKERMFEIETFNGAGGPSGHGSFVTSKQIVQPNHQYLLHQVNAFSLDDSL